MKKPDGFAYGLGLIGSQPRSVGASLDIKHASLALCVSVTSLPLNAKRPLQLHGPPILIKIGPLQLYDPPSLIKIGPLQLYDV